MAARLRTGMGGGGLSWLQLLLMTSTVLGLARCSKRDKSEVVVVVRVDEDVCVDNCTAMLIRLQVELLWPFKKQTFFDFFKLFLAKLFHLDCKEEA